LVQHTGFVVLFVEFDEADLGTTPNTTPETNRRQGGYRQAAGDATEHANNISEVLPEALVAAPRQCQFCMTIHPSG
jgi:hypothetical protein